MPAQNDCAAGNKALLAAGCDRGRACYLHEASPFATHACRLFCGVADWISVRVQRHTGRDPGLRGQPTQLRCAASGCPCHMWARVGTHHSIKAAQLTTMPDAFDLQSMPLLEPYCAAAPGPGYQTNCLAACSQVGSTSRAAARRMPRAPKPSQTTSATTKEATARGCG